MHKFIFFLVLFFGGMKAVGQQQYYLYIQSEEKQPFYARIQDKIYSSSENGYMIIPKLTDNTYDVTIGFSKNAYPEQRFPITIHKKDRGFLLKNTGERGWILTNLQTSAMIQNVNPPKQVNTEYQGVRKSDAFSQLLANVVNDSAILYTSVKVKVPEPPKEEKTGSVVVAEEKNIPVPEELTPASPVVINETKNQVEQAAAPVADPVKTEPKEKNSPAPAPSTESTEIAQREKAAASPAKSSFDKPFISKIAEYRTDEVFEAIYLEQYNFSSDTIRVLIPYNEKLLITSGGPAIKPAEPVKETQTTVKKTEEPVAATQPAAVEKTNTLEISNSDCKNMATENDLDKLRVRLMHDKAVDDKYITARKYFRNRCFTVSQIRALTELFPTDETKYRFFDIAFPFVSDTSNFYKLEDLIDSTYYKNRFKAMLQL
jgi:hypothetical protein